MEIVKSETDNQYEQRASEASLKGNTSDGGELTVNRMFLDKTTFKPDVKNGKTTFDGKTLNLDLGELSGNGYFDFFVASEVKIVYQTLIHNDVVSLIWGLTNFEFTGCERSTYGTTALWDKFSAMIGGFDIQFVHLINYSDVLSRLVANREVEVTAEAVIAAELGKLSDISPILHKACMILSFATSNWITTFYNDIFKDGQIIQTTLFPHKTFPFNRAGSIIQTLNSECYLKKFLEIAFSSYDRLREEFGIDYVIEYYIAALTQRLQEEKFLIGAVAFECLGSYVPRYADKYGEKLESGSVEKTRKQIKSVMEELSVNISDEQIKIIVDSIAYRGIGLKDRLRYIFKKFAVKYEEKELAFVNVRGELVHTGRYQSGNIITKIHDLFNLLDRTLLAMFGWKGQPYLDKRQRYKPVILE
jgi:hypothetical protein